MSGRLPDPAFWRGRRVFLTGHTGFKGSWLSLWLARMGAVVQGYALPPPTEPSLFEAARVAGEVGHTLGDIRDQAALARSLAAFGPEIVLHMAAQPLVLESYVQPVETYATNVMGTVHLLEAARHSGARATLIVTSDKCYENRDVIWGYREHDPMGGHDPYSNSKGCAELVTAAYAASYFGPAGLAIGSGRAGNVIGGGDWAKDRLMTDLIAALMAGRAPVLRSPAAVRPWQHVLEPLSGYLVAAEHLAQGRVPPGRAGDAWNFGPDAAGEVTVGAVAARICELWGSGLRPVVEDATRGKEARLLALDSTKARIELGWRPRWGIDRALAETVAWFQAWQGRADMRAVTLRQIDDYVDAAPAPAARQQEHA
ncbi:CDP-glucose 4,6-dehydratase [Roseomonas sp. GC11]|uniref:CDP-glucose 4,6-dehydratase n=1 Tax=Roseomonas sp. GC11 TaxID=2950546 RepID=UPI00210E2DC1|nr:CDP-glucose 4,6-dehydratase [Roseomonas sp. GC11]